MTTPQLLELVRKVDTLTDPWALLMGPAIELSKTDWRVVAVPPIATTGMVSLSFVSLEMGLFFAAVMIPLAAFFYWVISNLRRMRRTLQDINDVLQVMVGRDPAVMKRIQDAHRERLTRRAAR